MIIIEGIRNIGKTFLLSHLNRKIHQLEFIKFKESMNLNKELCLGFSYGKDIEILQIAKERFISKNLISDRGFLSSIIYSIILERDTKENINKFLKYLIDNKLLENIKIIYIYGENKNRRGDKDFLDNLENDKQLSLYNEYLELLPKETVIKFENKFDKESIDRFRKLIDEIIEVK